MGKKKREKAGKLEKPEKPGKKDKEAKQEKSGRKDKIEKPGKSEKKVKAEKSEKTGKRDKAEKLKKSGKIEKVEKPDEQKKPGKPDRFDRQEQLERQNVPGKSDKQKQTGITEGSEKTRGAVVAVFRALGDESRMKIIRLLSEKELCAMELLESVGVVQSTLSHHMKVLTEIGIVACRKEGKKVFYSIRRETMDRVADWLRDGAGK